MKKLAVLTWLIGSIIVAAPAAWAAEPGEVAEKATIDVAGNEKEITYPEEKKASGVEHPQKPEGITVERPVTWEQPPTGNGGEPVTQDDLEGVRAEINTLREQWQRSLDKAVVQSTRSLKFGGFAQGRYTVSGETNDTFEIPLFVLNLTGSLRRDYTEGKNLTYLFSVSSTSKNFNIQLLDAFITYSVFQSLDLEKPFLRASFGQQKKPFGLEAQATEEFKPVIRTAQAAVNLGLDPRDLGVVIRGDLFPHVDYGFNYRVPLIEYSFGVINGSGPNALDDNNDKDFVGRLVFNAPADYNNFFRGLSIGGSYYNGRKNATLTNGSASLTRKGTKDRWGADIAYVNTPVGFTFEYYRGDDYTLTGTPASPQQRVVKSEGYTATVFYNFGEQFVRGFKSQDRYDDWYPLTYQPFVRYDHWDPNINATGNRTDIWTAGFNWFFAETTKLQLNYNRKRTEVNGAKDRFDEFLVQFQFGF